MTPLTLHRAQYSRPVVVHSVTSTSQLSQCAATDYNTDVAVAQPTQLVLCCQHVSINVSCMREPWPGPQSSALAGCYHCCELKHLVMRQPVNDAIQYGANEGISSPSCVLYSFLQRLLQLSASPSRESGVTEIAYEHWQTLLLQTRLIHSRKCRYCNIFKA